MSKLTMVSGRNVPTELYLPARARASTTALIEIRFKDSVTCPFSSIFVVTLPLLNFVFGHKYNDERTTDTMSKQFFYVSKVAGALGPSQGRPLPPSLSVGCCAPCLLLQSC
jgi:hypothetical protein